MELPTLANITTIAGLPIAIIGLIIAYRSLRNQTKETNNKIDTINEIITLQNKYFSGGSQYHNCTFQSSPVVDSQQIINDFMQGMKVLIPV